MRIMEIIMTDMLKQIALDKQTWQTDRKDKAILIIKIYQGSHAKKQDTVINE